MDHFGAVYLDSPRVDGISAISIYHPWKNIMVFLSANYGTFLVFSISNLSRIFVPQNHHDSWLFKVAHPHRQKSAFKNIHSTYSTLQEIVGVRLPYLWFKNIQVPLSSLSLFRKPRVKRGYWGWFPKVGRQGGMRLITSKGCQSRAFSKIWKGWVMIKHPFLMCLFLQFI